MRRLQGFLRERRYDDDVVKRRNCAYPRICVVTPSYNQVEFLERTILSVLNQNYENLEYMVIDGGSTDGSVEIIRKYEKYLTYWQSQTDNGQADAINIGFRASTADVIAWQNSDDVYLPGALEMVGSWFAQNENVDVLFGNAYIIDGEDNILQEMRYHPFSVRHLIYYGWNLTNQAAFWKTTIFKKVGFLLNYPVAFDWEWFLRLGLAKFRFRFMHEFLGAYRMQQDSKLFRMRDRDSVEKNILLLHGIKCESINQFHRSHRFRKMYYIVMKLLYHIVQRDFRYIRFIVQNKLLPGSI